MSQLTRLCSVDGCGRKHYALGFCNMHWRRFKRNGDTEWHGPRKFPPVCTLRDCDRPHQAHGLCSMHLRRWEKHRDVRHEYRRHGHTWLDPDGYLLQYMPEHSLANSAGVVRQHRAIMWDIYGPGPHGCHWCGVSVNWTPEGPWMSMLTIDHLNFDKTDNDPYNLVLACPQCNGARQPPAGGSDRALAGVLPGSEGGIDR